MKTARKRKLEARAGVFKALGHPRLTALNVSAPKFFAGVDQLIKAIPQVWASPFTERAFAWRQSLMDKPENVYPAVLLLKSVANDKSGVLVTQDIDTGDVHIVRRGNAGNPGKNALGGGRNQ